MGHCEGPPSNPWTTIKYRTTKHLIATGREQVRLRSAGRQAGKTPLEKIIEVITRSADPDRIILFGSRARKDNKKTSDYDICVLKHGVSRRRQLAMQLYRDLYGIGVPVELIVETPEMFEKIKDNPFLIYHAIANQGKVIYEKPIPR